jgi:trehalose/maltose transport system permease protein
MRARRPPPLLRYRQRAARVLLAPALGLLLAVAAWPLARTALLAFSDATLGSPASGRWVGLHNFATLAADPAWWEAVANTLRFAALSVSLELVLGLGVALVLRRSFPGNGLLRAAVLLPWAVPNVVSARIWAWMANDVYGVLNDALLRAHLIAQPVAWLADPGTALAMIVAADVWKTTPFVALLLLAGLQAIPGGLYEAARVDGAGPWRCFRHVTLPLLRPALALALVFRLLDALRVFDVVYVLTGSSHTTATVSVYARQQLIDFQDFGYGSAAALAIFVLVGAVCAAVLTGLRVRLEAP